MNFDIRFHVADEFEFCRPVYYRFQFGNLLYMVSGSSTSISIPHDPPTGTKGTKIILQANYLRLNLDEFYKKKIFQYDVTIEPAKCRRLLPKVMEQFKQRYFATIGSVFDGSKFLLSLTKFDTEYCGEVDFTSEGYNKPIQFKIALKYTKEIDLGFFTNYKNNPNMKNYTEACQVLSIILRGYPLMKHLSIGKNFYIRPQTAIPLSSDMELLFGLHQAPVLTQRGILLNVDVLNKAYPMQIKDDKLKDVPLRDLICDICNLKNPTTLTVQQKSRVLDMIRSKKVSYTIKGQTLDYRVNDFNGTAIEEIIPDEGITVEEYYANMKQYKIKYPKLPLLWVGNRNRKTRILIPVECCVFKAGQTVIRADNSPEVVRNIIEQTKGTTDDRKHKITEMINKIGNYQASPYLKEFGIDVGTEFEVIQGRVLAPPSLLYKTTSEIPNKGTWNCVGKMFQQPCCVGKWVVINLDSRFNNKVTDVERRVS